MKLSLLAATLVACTLAACGKPNQALPEQEKANFEKVTSQPGAGNTAAEAAAPAPIAADEDMSGPIELGGPRLDGNGNPVPEGQEVHKPAAH